MRIMFLLVMALLISNYIKCQPVVGMNAGFTTAKSPVLNLQIGFKISESLVYYNQLIHLPVNSSVPQILGLRYGYNIGSFQPNVGLDYHMFSTDKFKVDKPKEGFHFAFGITKYFKSMPIKIDVGMSNKYIIGGIGFYKILD